jgi:hypothetical protein
VTADMIARSEACTRVIIGALSRNVTAR